MSTQTVPQQKQVERLDEIFALPDDWYGPHSVATTEPAKAMARGVLTALTDAGAADSWGIFPRENGGVLFEQITVLDTDKTTAGYAGWVADIEIDPEGPVWTYLLDMRPDGGEEECTFGDSLNAVQHVLTLLKERP